MNEATWEAVDRYINDLIVRPDAALEAAVEASEKAGLPSIQVSAAQGMLLHILARSLPARSILEVGTLGGYSAIWLARALPEDGRLVTVELEPKHAEVARANLERAGVAGKVEIHVGPALEILPRLEREGRGPFDLVFLDADKKSNADYLEWGIRLGRPGTLIITDNVIRDGEVIDAESEDPAVRGVRRFNERLASLPGVVATEIQTVGVKGYDGLAIALVTGKG